MLGDAMNAGVNPGGLQSRTEIRVLICYLLHNIASPLPLDTVKEKLHFEGISNYFETAFAIGELEESNNIKCVRYDKSTKYYAPDGDCATIAANLGNSVPLSIRERAIEICEEIISREKNEQNNKFSKVAAENGIYVTCTVMDNQLELASIRILVPDDQAAETVKENFFKNPIETLIKATEGLMGKKL